MAANSKSRYPDSNKGTGNVATSREVLANDLNAIVIRFMTRQLEQMWLQNEHLMQKTGVFNGLDTTDTAVEKSHTFVQVTYLNKIREKLLNTHLQQLTESDLYIVDVGEIDELSSVNAMHSRAMNMYRHRLEHLEARLDYLNNGKAEQLSLNNYLPECYCASLQEALSEAEYSLERRQAVYASFNDAVIGEMGVMYDAMNKRLAEAGVLVDIDKKKIHIDPRVYSNNRKNEKKTSPAQGCARPSRIIPPARPAQVKNVFNAYIHGDAVGDTEHYSTRGKSDSNVFSREEIIDALSTLQMRMLHATGSDRRMEDREIISALIEQMERRYIRKGNEHLHVMDVRLIEFVGMMFEAFTEDHVISSVIVSQIVRLQIPVIKTAMLDADVFVNDRHPVRHVLECIVEAGDDVYTTDDEVYIEIDSIIQELIRNYTDDIGEFEVAADALKILVEHKSSKYDNRKRQAQRARLFTEARKDVLKEMKAVTQNKIVNAKVKTLILKHLPSLLTQRHIKRGVDSKAWQHAVALVEKIVGLVQPGQDVKDPAALHAQHAEVVETLRWELLRAKQSPGAIEAAIEGLEETFERLLSSPGQTAKANRDAPVHPQPEKPVQSNAEAEVISGDIAENTTASVAEDQVAETGLEKTEVEVHELEVTETAARKESTADDAPVDTRATAAAVLPECVRPGVWFEVYDGEDRPVRRLKLSMVIDDEARLVFVNSRSIHVLEKEVDVFIRELRESKSRLYADSSAFESALGQVIHRLVA